MSWKTALAAIATSLILAGTAGAQTPAPSGGTTTPGMPGPTTPSMPGSHSMKPWRTRGPWPSLPRRWAAS